ncbi:DUF3857 domain-containing protein [Flavobacterium wongokense]|uniref:DUF3857 domain-containing protein n=1 Tax=Flavobacterium wongokense TaxID=2910674 RepID=UPI001F29F7C4|nr:DUF3857 domain-containing protein [Flavobacterium sp. WG47]MCF6133323.1 DUF3857 and transglutaminase domain-containing protein [Flavobacterium sp. WG47]
MNKSNLLLFLLICCLSNAVGQKLILGKVTKAELLEKQHKTDTSAAAAIIFKKARTEFTYTEQKGFTSVTYFQVKLKIYKNEGLKWANFKIPYYVGYENLEDEYVSIESGFTYNLENDKIVKTKVTGESKFKEQINENWEVKAVAFPNVKPGSIIELEYRFKSENISVLPEFQYQYDIPVDYAEYKTNIPEFYIYNAIKKGYIKLNMDQKLESTYQSYQSEAHLAKVSRTLEYNQIVTVYNASNIPALIEEDYVNNMDNYYGQLEHELQMIRYPNEKPKQIGTTWEAVAKSIFDDKDFNEAITSSDYFIEEVKPLIHEITSPQERAKKIFNYVKNRMNWDNRTSYYPKRKMNVAFTEKVGNVAEINLMLVAMLRYAGINANPVIMSTRENGFATFPNRTLFNYVIAAAEIDGKTILMDATEKISDLNSLPIRALNWQGRLIRKDGTSTEIDLMPKSNSRKIVNLMIDVNASGDVSGKIKNQYFDYNAREFRNKNNAISKESYVEKLEKENPGLEVEDYGVHNSLDIDLPIIENYNFATNNGAEIIGGKIYMSPFLFFATTQNPFKQEYRDYPIDFVFPQQLKYNISLTIPQGYAVETLPEPKNVALPSGLGSFKYEISNVGKQIQLLYTQEINQSVIDAGYYEVLKIFFKEMIDKQTEKIVLKKV